MPSAIAAAPTPWLVGHAARPAVDLDAGLAPWIADVDRVAGTGRHTLVQAPDVASVLVVRTDPQGHTDLVVAGPRTRGTYHPADRTWTCTRLRVRAGRTRALLGAPVSDLADRATPVEALWGALGRRLVDEVAVRVPGDDVIRTVAEALRERARSVPGDAAEARLVGAAMRALSPETGPAPRLGVVADRLGISERHLRTIFAREVGLSPKHYARIARMRRVLALAGTRQWAHVAAETGFFDQAHLIADFRALMGVSPGAYLTGTLPDPSPCRHAVA